VGGRSERLTELRQAFPDATPGDPPAPVSSLDSLARRLSELPPGHPSSTSADARRTVDDPSDTYWDQVEHLEQLWQQHTERWPDRPRPEEPERAEAGPPGSWRGDGGRYLSPDQNATADKLITKLREPEPAITADLREIEQSNGLGGYLAGLEHRLKGTSRLKEKIADGFKAEIAGSADVEISDAVRYTFCFNQANYSNGYGLVRDQLESSGYELVYSKNRWINDRYYSGVNTRWETSDGLRFEVQFHTPESFHAKEQLTHRAYQRLRLGESSRAEREQLYAYQSIVNSSVPVPASIADIRDRKKDPDA